MIRNEVLIVKDLEIVVFISKLVRAGFDSRAVEKRKCFSPLLFWWKTCTPQFHSKRQKRENKEQAITAFLKFHLKWKSGRLPLKGKCADASVEEINVRSGFRRTGLSTFMPVLAIPGLVFCFFFFCFCCFRAVQSAVKQGNVTVKNKKWPWQSNSQSWVKWHRKKIMVVTSRYLKKNNGSEAVFFSKLKSWIILAHLFT